MTTYRLRGQKQILMGNNLVSQLAGVGKTKCLLLAKLAICCKKKLSRQTEEITVTSAKNKPLITILKK